MADRDRAPSPGRGPRTRQRRQYSSDRRSRSRSFSDDYRSADYTDYSDSFVSDDERPPPRRNKPPPKNARKPVTAPYRSHKTKTKNGLQKAATDLQRMNPVARIMQAEKRMKVNELRSELDRTALKCRDLEEENKVLKRLQRRQEKALTKFEDQESDLPQLLQRHNNELRTLKDQLRKTREKHARTERSLHDAEMEREQLRRQVNKYRELADDKGLPERDELHRRVLAAEADNQDKDRRITELERHLENLSKNHKHQIGIEVARHRDLQRRHDEMSDQFSRMQIQLKEKEKELEIKNIYANRMSRPQRQAVSYQGTPHESPSPGKADRQRRLSNSELTPRQKMKAYEQERKQKEKNKQDQEKKNLDKNAWQHLELGHLEAEDLKRQNEEKERHERENRERKAQEEREIRERVEREEQEIRLRLEQEEQERKKREQKRLAEERERKQQEEKERAEREEREREEQRRREHEERERQRQEEERKAREERERFENDVRLQEERRKKDDLLARLQKLDSNAVGKKEEASPFFMTTDGNSGASSAASKKSSYSFSQATENMHNGKPAYEDVSVPYLEKKKMRRQSSTEEEGYQPSFAGTNAKHSPQHRNKPVIFSSELNSTPPEFGKNNQKARKVNLMNELFGKSQDNNPATVKREKSKDKTDLIVDFDSNKSPSRTKFPWDDASGDKVGSGSSSKLDRQSSALFGGGTALVDSDSFLTDNPGQLLPRRPRQPATAFQSKPAVNAVDHFDDDIEEVIL